MVLVSPAQWLAGHVLSRNKELDGEERVDVQLNGTKEQVSKWTVGRVGKWVGE